MWVPYHLVCARLPTQKAWGDTAEVKGTTAVQQSSGTPVQAVRKVCQGRAEITRAQVQYRYAQRAAENCVRVHREMKDNRKDESNGQ